MKISKKDQLIIIVMSLLSIISISLFLENITSTKNISSGNRNYKSILMDSFGKSAINIKTKDIKLIDSIEIEKLKKEFYIIEDEFEKGVFFYNHKDNPKYINQNSIHCYFYTINNKLSNLKLKFQYYDDEWLFIESLQFVIDDKNYSYIPLNVDRDNGSGKIWEWFDDEIYNLDLLIKVIAKSENIKMKINGNKYFKIKTVNKKQINSIKSTLELYNLLEKIYVKI